MNNVEEYCIAQESQTNFKLIKYFKFCHTRPYLTSLLRIRSHLIIWATKWYYYNPNPPTQPSTPTTTTARSTGFFSPMNGPRRIYIWIYTVRHLKSTDLFLAAMVEQFKEWQRHLYGWTFKKRRKIPTFWKNSHPRGEGVSGEVGMVSQLLTVFSSES